MTAPTMTFVFPMPANRANGSRSWKGDHFGKQRYYKQCDERQNAGLFPRPPATPMRRCAASVVMYLGSEMDNDNAAGRTKFCWDWLKTRGYIVDDSPKHVHQSEYPSQRIKRNQNYRVEITLTALEIAR